MLPSWKESYDKHRLYWKTEISLCWHKVHIIKSMIFLVVVYRCESWTMKKADCQRIDGFWTVVLKKTLESPLECKIKPVNPKGNKPWIFTGRIDAEADAPILWPPDAKSRFIGKDPDPGKDWRQKEKGPAEDEIVRWHHWVKGHEFEQIVGDSGGQRSLSMRSQSQTWLRDRTTKITNEVYKTLVPVFQKFTIESLKQRNTKSLEGSPLFHIAELASPWKTFCLLSSPTPASHPLASPVSSTWTTGSVWPFPISSSATSLV